MSRSPAELFTLDPSVAHLNHGSYGAVPLPVQRIQARIRAAQERDPDGAFLELPRRIAGCRAEVAEALGGSPERLALIGNVTEGVAVVLDSLQLAPGDEILVTDHGYGVVTRAAQRRAAETGAVVRTVAVPLDTPDRAAVAELVLAAVGERTRVAVLDLVTSPTAREIAGPELLAALAARGVVTVVDAAHAPGMLPVDLAGAAQGADFWIGNLHKWAFAPRAAAVLAVAERWPERIRPLTFSWEHDTGFPGRVEWRGTCDYTPWLAAPSGFALLRRLGGDAVRARNAELAEQGARELAELAGLARLPVMAGASMRALRLPAGVAEDEAGARGFMAEVRRRLAARIAVRPWAGGGILRISAQLYNRPEEYEKLALGLAEMLGR